MTMTVHERLDALRAEMQTLALNACIIPGTDPHASEYMAPHWMEMQWVSGFNGESGVRASGVQAYDSNARNMRLNRFIIASL